MTADQLVNAMVVHKLAIWLEQPDEHGSTHVGIPPTELIAYLHDPVAWLASHYQVSRSQYLDWHESGYVVRCAGQPSRGQSCRSIVTGGTQVSLLGHAANR